MKAEQIKISYVETKTDSERARAELEDEWNLALQHMYQARQDDMDEAYEYSADPTDTAKQHLDRICELQDMLREWQNRYGDGHDEVDCDGDCPRDHDAEARDTVRETIWEQQRDEAA